MENPVLVKTSIYQFHEQGSLARTNGDISMNYNIHFTKKTRVNKDPQRMIVDPMVMII